MALATVLLVVLLVVAVGLAMVVVALRGRLQLQRQRCSDLEESLSAAQSELAAQRASDASMRSMDDLLRPVRESLESLRRVTDEAGRERTAAEAAITTALSAVSERYAALDSATAAIASALSRGQTRGQWGEMQLERLLEHAGLLEGTHFSRQQTRSGDDGVTRPDVVVLMPGGGEILVDAKFPFDAYWQSISSSDEGQREAFLAKHATDTLARVRELSGKRYSDATTTADFVVMFLPLESLLSTALEVDGLLLERAFERRVILATPTTMLALLRTVAFGYQRRLLVDNAEQIRQAGAEMLTRLGVLVEHLDGMRRGLDQAVRGYNAFVGSFDRQALRQARRLSDLGVATTRPLDAPAEIEIALRSSDPVALRE
ncbi:MAG: DNA recombination protein RmuC [Actinomycetales bacterium]|nr:DNA recombination protein RmuC [Actinomycetales bacterium]